MFDAFCIPSADITGPQLRQTICVLTVIICASHFFKCGPRCVSRAAFVGPSPIRQVLDAYWGTIPV